MARTKNKKKRERKPRFKRIDDWKDGANDPLVLALIEAYSAYKKAKNTGECSLAQRAQRLRQRFGEPMAVEIVAGVLHLTDYAARQIVASGFLWERHGNMRLWEAVGRRGVERIDSVRPVEAQQPLVEDVLAWSDVHLENSGSPIVSVRYIDGRIAQRSLVVDPPPTPSKRSKTKVKSQTVLTLEAAKVALREMHDLLARTPAMEGCFSTEALAAIKKVK